jgi:hypothetical protein
MLCCMYLGQLHTVQTLDLILPSIQRIPQLHFRIESKFLLRLLLCMPPNFTLSFHYPDLGGTVPWIESRVSIN